MSNPLAAHRAAGAIPAHHDALVQTLLDAGQRHLFDGWPDPGDRDADKLAMLDVLARAHAAYPGGLGAYVTNARRLLAGARTGGNPYDGLVPERPERVDLSELGPDLRHHENLGLAHAQGLAVVLVAGGLGERLGFPGIKVDIRVDLTSDQTYLDLYGRWLRALGRRTGRQHPLVIMTSGDTHAATLASLARLDWLGLGRERVHVLQQQLVPALADDQARIATEGPTRVLLKPHGHGDVHLLLHQSGVAARLADEGFTHLAFIQDTNAQVVNSLLPTLGVSVARDFAFNSVAVPRVAGEAVGAMTRLRGGVRDLTVNVEYNQLDGLLRNTVEPRGDVGDAQGLSPFPGNTNTLLIALDAYLPVLQASGGVIAEFVNPKYADADKMRFKKPTRLETMMQDLPRLFAAGERVGVTVFDRRWVFSADKNNLVDARAKAAAGRPAECAATAEDDWYDQGRRTLAAAGAELAPPEPQTWEGIPVDGGARVSLDPSFALVLDDVTLGRAQLGPRCHLHLAGDVTLTDLVLTGNAALTVRAAPGARVQIDGLVLDGPGAALEALGHGQHPADLAIRGYRLVARSPLVVDVTEGDWILGPRGRLTRR